MRRFLILLILTLPVYLLAQEFPFVQIKKNIVSYYLNEEYQQNENTNIVKLANLFSEIDEMSGDQVIAELSQKKNLDYNLGFKLLESLHANGSWDDINYFDQSRSGWEPKKHAERILFLAKVYLTRESPLFQSPKLSSALHLALNFWFENPFVCPNWWYNDIGIPRTFAPIFVLLENELTGNEKQAAVKVLNHSRFGMTGQNKVWLAGNILFKALLLNDSSLVIQARNQIFSEIISNSAEGIQPDYSFHQHGPQQQFGNYGLSFVGNMTFWALMLKDTNVELATSQKKILRDFLLNAYDWIVWKGYFDVNGLDRQLFKNAQSSKSLAVATTMIDMSVVDSEHAYDYLEFIKRNYTNSNDNNLTGNKHFWNSDQTIHRAQSWFASVKMSSSRVIGAESVNGDNLKGYHMADGATFVSVQGDEYQNIFPIWDWKKIPGITSYQNPKPLKVLTVNGYKNNSDFTGGVSSGELGIAVTQLNRDSLSAKKTWFFIDNMLVCLGSDINSVVNSDVATTINQCHLKGNISYFDNSEKNLASNSKITSNRIKWVYHNSIGYYLLNPSNITLSDSIQEGNWQDIMLSCKPERVSGPVFSLSCNHGVQPTKSSYAYAITPNCTLASMKNISMKFKLIRNDQNSQVIVSNDKKIAMIVVYKALKMRISTFGMIELDNPGLYIIEKENDGCKISVSDPTHKLDKVLIRINRKISQIDLHLGSKAGMSVSKIISLE